MKKRFTLLLSIGVLSVIVFESCNKEDDDDPAPSTPSEFVADDESFAGFESWTLVETKMGADPALGGFAHGGNDSTVTRNIYFENDAEAVNGEYPLGTLIAKRSTSPGGMDMITAMAKRGKNYSPGGGDWEFFILEEDGSIALDASTGDPLRGSMLNNGGCLGCHSTASVDFVFTKE